MKEVNPVDHRDTPNGYYKYEYKFQKIHVDDVPSDFDPDINGVDVQHRGNCVVWSYKEEPAVYLYPDSVEVREDVPIRDGENQAYFALSVLDSNGYVSMFKKS